MYPTQGSVCRLKMGSQETGREWGRHSQGLLLANLFDFSNVSILDANSFNLTNDSASALLIPLKLQMGPAEVRMGEVRVPGNEVCELGFLPTCAAQ